MQQESRTETRQNPDSRNRWGSAVLQFAMLFVFWLVLSGRFQWKYIIIGAISAGTITFFTKDYFYSVLRKGEFSRIDIGRITSQMVKFLAYIPWLMFQIIVANIQVAYYVLHPRMPVKPGFLVFTTTMKKGMSRVTLANSITLTPGTITVSLDEDKYIIHSLEPSLSTLVVSGRMQQKVGRVFLEEPEPPPRTRWAYSVGEISE